MSLAVSGNYYGAGAGVDSYAPGGASKFIPEVWSGKLQVKFYQQTVLANITNNDWEGEIKDQGDVVRIRSVPTITIRDYQKGLALQSEVPVSTPITLNIDQGKYFNFLLDDVDKVQNDINAMDTFSTDAAQQMKISIDASVLNAAKIRTAIPAANKGATAGVISGNINLGVTGTAVQITTSNALDFLLDLGLVLDEQNIPEEGRFVVLPAWYIRRLKASDLKFAYLTGDDQTPLRNGKVGVVDRFTIYSSNAIANIVDGPNTCNFILAGTKAGISFASQMTQMETIRSTSTFGNLVRGLNVYGFDVTLPTALALGYVRK